MVFRIAWGLACNPAPEHRWRRVAVPVSALIFMLLVLAATSIVVMVHRGGERVAQRTALLASKPSPTDLFVVEGDDVWNGRQFAVVWIQPTGEARPVLPPGMEKLPRPGQAVVSPALDRLASQHPELAKRYPDRLVLGSQGIQSGDELFAYIRVPEGRTLAGSRDAMRVHAFGPPAGGGRFWPLTLDEALQEITVPVAEGVLGFLVVPALLVLSVGLAAASEVRDKRFAVLRAIGTPGKTLVMLGVLETLLLAVPGLVLATILWRILSPHLARVPLVGYEAVQGDLGLPGWLLAVELLSGIVVTALVATLVAGVRGRRGATRPRPSSGRAAITPLRAAPLVFALVAFVLGQIIPVIGGTLTLAGIVAAAAGVPLVLPGVLRAAGGALGRLGSVSAQLAGRSLQWDPVRTSRPFAGVTVLIVLALVGSGYLALVRYVEPSPGPLAAGPQAVTVSWLDPHPDDLNRFADALGTGLVVPARTSDSTLTIGATCRDVVRYFADAPPCDPKVPYRLPVGMRQRVKEALGGVYMRVRLAPQDEIADSGSALVLGDAPLKVLEERVRTAAMRTLPAPFVYSALSTQMSQSPLVPWVVGGVVAAAIVLTVGCLISLVDRLLAARRHHRLLLNLGVVPGRLTAIEAWLFAAPYAAVVALSFGVGLLICALIIGFFSGVPMPWHDIGIVAGVAVVVGIAGTASVAAFGARSVLREPE